MFRVLLLIISLMVSVDSWARVDINRFIDARQSGAVYNFKWDGWSGRLYMLKPRPGKIWGNAYLISNGKVFTARYWFLNAAVDSVVVDPPSRYSAKGLGYRGVGDGSNRILLHIDLDQNGLGPGDQGFDGYVFTQTMNAFAGVTWWNKIPFSFYAERISSWDGDVEYILPTP